MLAEQVPPTRPRRKVKGPAIIESEDEASEATSKAAQGRAKPAPRVRVVSPVRGVSSVDGVEDEVFAGGKCSFVGVPRYQLTEGLVSRQWHQASCGSCVPRSSCAEAASSGEGLIRRIRGLGPSEWAP